MARESTLARSGLDLLLAIHPTWDLVHYEWQDEGPWVVLALGRPGIAQPRSEYAIWKGTGDVYAVVAGAVSDEPFLKVADEIEGIL